MLFFAPKNGSRSIDLRMQLGKLEVERDDLTDRNTQLKQDVEMLKATKDREERELQHLMKMKEEALEIKFQKKEIELERTQQTAIAEVKDTYRDKMEAELKNQLGSMQTMYGQILERLPTIKVKGLL